MERIVIKEGDQSIKPKVGKPVTVHYVGKLKGTDKVFDSSRQKGRPFTFTLGAGEGFKKVFLIIFFSNSGVG
jgi:FKBP-type peptidyl-prolyl cis-trans isomerase